MHHPCGILSIFFIFIGFSNDLIKKCTLNIAKNQPKVKKKKHIFLIAYYLSSITMVENHEPYPQTINLEDNPGTQNLEPKLT